MTEHDHKHPSERLAFPLLADHFDKVDEITRLSDEVTKLRARRFVAVICLNAYPHAVTASYDTQSAAAAAGEAERERLTAYYNSEARLRHGLAQYIHVHTFQQPEL